MIRVMGREVTSAFWKSSRRRSRHLRLRRTNPYAEARLLAVEPGDSSEGGDRRVRGVVAADQRSKRRLPSRASGLVPLAYGLDLWTFWCLERVTTGPPSGNRLTVAGPSGWTRAFASSRENGGERLSAGRFTDACAVGQVFVPTEPPLKTARSRRPAAKMALFCVATPAAGACSDVLGTWSASSCASRSGSMGLRCVGADNHTVCCAATLGYREGRGVRPQIREPESMRRFRGWSGCQGFYVEDERAKLDKTTGRVRAGGGYTGRGDVPMAGAEPLIERAHGVSRAHAGRFEAVIEGAKGAGVGSERKPGQHRHDGEVSFWRKRPSRGMTLAHSVDRREGGCAVGSGAGNTADYEFD